MPLVVKAGFEDVQGEGFVLAGVAAEEEVPGVSEGEEQVDLAGRDGNREIEGLNRGIVTLRRRPSTLAAYEIRTRGSRLAGLIGSSRCLEIMTPC